MVGQREYGRKAKMVGVHGFEPWASRSQSVRSTRLSYTPLLPAYNSPIGGAKRRVGSRVVLVRSGEGGTNGHSREGRKQVIAHIDIAGKRDAHAAERGEWVCVALSPTPKRFVGSPRRDRRPWLG